MTINVIYDQTRPVPNETIAQELAGLRLYYRVNWWHAVKDPSSVVKSIGDSHKMIVANAKANGLKEVMIVEEDVLFTHPDSLEYFLSHKPEKFDLYLAGCYGLNFQCIQRMDQKGFGAHEIHNFAGLHCYIIHERYYDKFLALPEDKHIDDQPGLGLFYVCYPFAALQHPGWSANNRKMVNYNVTLIHEMIYNGKGEEANRRD